MRSKLYHKLLWLDCATLKSDPLIIKVLKRKLFKPIGFYFRKKYFEITYK